MFTNVNYSHFDGNQRKTKALVNGLGLQALWLFELSSLGRAGSFELPDKGQGFRSHDVGSLVSDDHDDPSEVA